MEKNPMYVLLPICVEFEHDVFLNLLRNVVSRVGRTKWTDHCLDNAFKSGMTAENIVVGEEEVTSNWKNCNTQQNRILQSKLLGHWSVTNCPTFGKVFFGKNWLPSKENLVKFETRNCTKIMTAAEIDRVIFPKLKCYVVELDVCETTLTNLKHFVKVPINEIHLEYKEQISSKIKSFNIKEEYLKKCWAALKHGEWLVDTEVRKYQNYEK